jgi:hypothetical protein
VQNHILNETQFGNFMINTLLTIDWNADPNAPELQMEVDGTSVTLDFFVNNFVFDKFKDGDKAKLTFYNCLKYSFNSMNDEGYYMEEYRYKNSELPWGEFYKLDTNWESDFPKMHTNLDVNADEEKMNHYIYFFKDNTFECVAEGYLLEFYNNK